MESLKSKMMGKMRPKVRVILWLTLLVYIYDIHDFFSQMFRVDLVGLGLQDCQNMFCMVIVVNVL
jgi:hypothetical protein